MKPALLSFWDQTQHPTVSLKSTPGVRTWNDLSSTGALP
jgi:hypothetical protein